MSDPPGSWARIVLSSQLGVEPLDEVAVGSVEVSLGEALVVLPPESEPESESEQEASASSARVVAPIVNKVRGLISSRLGASERGCRRRCCRREPCRPDTRR